jgi:hypothetical protein
MYGQALDRDAAGHRAGCSGLAGLEAVEAPIGAGIELTQNGPGLHRRLGNDHPVGLALGCQPNNVDAIMTPEVGGLPERLVEGVGLRLGDLDEDNGRGD